MRISFVVALLLLSGCKVDTSYLDTDLFECVDSSECGEGWGCLQAEPYAVDFCAPDCGEASCDGVCTGGDEPLCLRGCTVRADGESGGCPEDFSCIRSSLERDDGVCYPTSACNKHEDCPGSDVCLTQLLAEGQVGAVAEENVNNFYCLPTTDRDDGCPVGSYSSEAEGLGLFVCLPECSVADPACPPGMGCLRQLSLLFPPNELPCLAGGYGIPCEDDTNCLQGRCRDTGPAGSFCTLTCNEADERALGCPNLIGGTFLSLFQRMECDPTVNGGEDGGVCVPRYEASFPCTESEVYGCASGLECRDIGTLGGQPIDLCTQDCVRHADCNDVPAANAFYCNPVVGLCLRRGFPGENCFDDAECLSSTCQLPPPPGPEDPPQPGFCVGTAP